jgi:hypothetical protein
MDGCMDGWLDGWIDAWMDEWIRQIVVTSLTYPLTILLLRGRCSILCNITMQGLTRTKNIRPNQDKNSLYTM